MIEINKLMSKCLIGILILFKIISIKRQTPGAIVPAITLNYLKLPFPNSLSYFTYISKSVSSFIDFIPEKFMKYINMETKASGTAYT